MAGPDVNPYELLGVRLECTEAEIKTAYRQRSLKVHPDRHPNNPDAAGKFHELNQAYELLLDPIRRTSLDAGLRVKLARQERFAKYDVKRKGMQDELEQAERAVKRAKMDKAKEERDKKEEVERIKEEGRRMREERQAEITQREEHGRKEEREERVAVQLGPLDTTVRLKYPLSQYPTLTTRSALNNLLSTFGIIDEPSIVISMKPSKKTPHKPPTRATALIPFRNIGDALAAVCASRNEHKGLKDVEISWAEGNEPAVLEVLKRQGRVESSESRQATRASGIPGLDYESITLMRLRQAERDRLEREIREKETELDGVI